MNSCRYTAGSPNLKRQRNTSLFNKVSADQFMIGGLFSVHSVVLKKTTTQMNGGLIGQHIIHLISTTYHLRNHKSHTAFNVWFSCWIGRLLLKNYMLQLHPRCSFTSELPRVMICFETTLQNEQQAEVSWERLGCPFRVLKVTVACNCGKSASERELDGRMYWCKLCFQQ